MNSKHDMSTLDAKEILLRFHDVIQDVMGGDARAVEVAAVMSKMIACVIVQHAKNNDVLDLEDIVEEFERCVRGDVAALLRSR